MKPLSIQKVVMPPKPAKNLNNWVKFHKFVNKVLISGKAKDQTFTPQF